MKLKKCFKLTLMMAGILAVIAWVFGSLGEHHRRLGNGARGVQGIRNGNWLPQSTNFHNHFHHGGFHILGFIVAAVLWGILIVAVITIFRKRKFKRQSNVISYRMSTIQDFQQQASPNGDFLDQWEKNLTTLKEDSTYGNL